MTNIITKSQWLYIGGRKAAKLRNWGTLLDIRRHSNGFMYNGTAVAINESWLENLGDSVNIQITNLDTKDVWTCTVRDFRRMAEPICFAGYEPQRLAYMSKMNHTRSGKKPRVNELVHIEAEPEPPQIEQLSLFG